MVRKIITTKIHLNEKGAIVGATGKIHTVKDRMYKDKLAFVKAMLKG